MAGSFGPLLIVLFVFAGMLLVFGGVIVTLQVLHKPSPFPLLINRKIDPHLWGFHVLGSGFMLSLVLMSLRQTPWTHEGWTGRAIVTASVLWIVWALATSVLAVIARPSTGGSTLFFPTPEAKVATWSRVYRAFIAMGFAALCALWVIGF
jgi:hypothetical protein